MNHGGNDGNHHCDEKGDNRQRNGHFQTGQQNLRERFYQQFDNAFTHGLLKVPSIPNRRQRQSRFLAQKWRCCPNQTVSVGLSYHADAGNETIGENCFFLFPIAAGENQRTGKSVNLKVGLMVDRHCLFGYCAVGVGFTPSSAR